MIESRLCMECGERIDTTNPADYYICDDCYYELVKTWSLLDVENAKLEL